jgi:integrase
MAHKPFHLYKRPATKKNKYLWYVRFYDEEGNRLAGRSTGQTSKAAAETWAFEQLKRGLISSPKNITFGKYAEDWWIWDKCPYIKGKIARGVEISRSYADLMRAYLVHHILPYFKNIKLQKINTRLIENWLLNLSEKLGITGKILSPATVNHCLTCLKIMLKEAVRLEYLNKSPADSIIQLKDKPKEKSILTIDEVKELFQDDNINRVWDRDHQHYTINLLSASTGMRLGECQALHIQHIHDKYVSVVFRWNEKYGLGVPKKNSQREVPIPLKTSAHLYDLISISPYKDPKDFVFFGNNRKTPIRGKIVLNALYQALENIGITVEERKERNITFHSWRHFYNSLLRGKIHDAKLRRLTGHRTLEMTEHYTHFKIEDFQDVMKIQEQYFE